MKILLDECLYQKLRNFLIGHDCQTAAYAKLAGLKNGVLLAAAELRSSFCALPPTGWPT